jgi:hypothetical protein
LPPASLAPEHHWAAAATVLHPVLRPAGSAGIDGRQLSVPHGGAMPSRPLIAAGPAGLVVAYVIPGPGFGIFAGVEHLLSWSAAVDEVHAAAMANLAAWSAAAPWTAEVSGSRRIVWSASGGGMDAARILLPEVRAHLAAELGDKVLIGLPERDLLIAAGLANDDDEFRSLFAAYVAERAAEAEDPIDSQIFVLADGELARF